MVDRLMAALRTLAFAVLAAAMARPAIAAPLAAYASLPSIEAVAVSPSGHALALVLTTGEQRMIVVKSLVDGAISLRAPTGEAKVRRVTWAGDQHLLIVTSSTTTPKFIRSRRSEWWTAHLLDLQKAKATLLLRDLELGMNTIFDMPVVRIYEGEPTVFVQGVQFRGGEGLLALYRVSLGTATSRTVAEGESDTSDWVVGPDGGAVAQELYDPRSGRWTLKLRGSFGWREVEVLNAPIDPPRLRGLGRDGRSVVYEVKGEDGTWSWREARLDGEAPSVPLGLSGDHAPLNDPQDGRLIGHYVLAGETGRYTFFEPADAQAWQSVASAYPGQQVDLESWSADRKKIAVRVDSPREGPAYAFVDLAAGKATWIGPEYVGLKAEDIALKQLVRFEAADGLELSGYLTRPRNRPARNLPLIVFPHGGPASRDRPGFDWWAQAMASRGYAVLQVNFRGSEGLGPPLLKAGYGEWGRKMQSDLSDGVRHLAGLGVIDPARVCIVGGSYGGYAALAGVTIERGVYRCAVSYAGVADLRRQVAYSRARGGAPSERYWNRFLGVDDRDDEVLAQYSPAQIADRANAPILLIHGRDDSVVPLEQSRVMAEP